MNGYVSNRETPSKWLVSLRLPLKIPNIPAPFRKTPNRVLPFEYPQKELNPGVVDFPKSKTPGFKSLSLPWGSQHVEPRPEIFIPWHSLGTVRRSGAEALDECLALGESNKDCPVTHEQGPGTGCYSSRRYGYGSRPKSYPQRTSQSPLK